MSKLRDLTPDQRRRRDEALKKIKDEGREATRFGWFNALVDSEVGGSRLLVGTTIWRHGGKSDIILSQETVAEKSGTSVSTVKRSTNQLGRDGWLVTIEPEVRGRGHANLYIYTMPGTKKPLHGDGVSEAGNLSTEERKPLHCDGVSQPGAGEKPRHSELLTEVPLSGEPTEEPKEALGTMQDAAPAASLGEDLDGEEQETSTTALAVVQDDLVAMALEDPDMPSYLLDEATAEAVARARAERDQESIEGTADAVPDPEGYDGEDQQEQQEDFEQPWSEGHQGLRASMLNFGARQEARRAELGIRRFS